MSTLPLFLYENKGETYRATLREKKAKVNIKSLICAKKGKEELR